MRYVKIITFAVLLIEVTWVSVRFGEGHPVAAFIGFSILALTLSAVVRAVEAVFSKRIRRSIREHPVAHLVWFGLAVVGLLMLLPAFVPAKTKAEALDSDRLTLRWSQRRLPLEFMDGLSYTTIIEIAEPLAGRRGSAFGR
jgi:mannose/fructose/N-acetylgalactosamine-specific phosphotransferase system component IIC